MAIQERLLNLRFHFLFAALFVIAVFFLLRLGPGFLTVLSFFWPLLLSTVFFFAAVAVLRQISPPPHETSGEELMDFVAGRLEDKPLELQGRGEEEEREPEAEVDRRKSQ